MTFAHKLIDYVSALLAMVLLAGCSSYHPLSLPTQPSFIPKPDAVIMPSPLFSSEQVQHHAADPQNGFDMTDIAMLAVMNNPDLKLARDDAKVAAAQSFAAGLLPDPQVNFSRLLPLNPGDRKGFDWGMSYDLNALLTHATQKRIANTAEQQINLNLLWQEWQVINQAQILFSQMVSQKRQLYVLKGLHQTLSLTYEHMQQALRAGDETLDNISNQLTALQTVTQQINTLKQQLNQNQHALNQLLGLAPETQLKLNSTLTFPLLHSSQIHRALLQLATRRPDLLALQAGYQSQDLKYRLAILEQFPSFNLGFSRSNDTTGTNTSSFGITFNLPVFNANRGNIAIEKATREKLYDDFQERINTAYSDVHRILDLQKLLLQQGQKSHRQLAVLQKTESAAKTAYQKGDMTLLTYSAIQTNLVNAKVEIMTQEQALLEQRIALQTLLGPWDSVRNKNHRTH